MTIHFERLSCGHQNNLLLKDSGNMPGVCPKGCTNPTALYQVDTESNKLIDGEVVKSLLPKNFKDLSYEQ